VSGGREREIKLRLPSPEAFMSLRDGAGWGARAAPGLQVSHYFDTAGHDLARSRALLRIRREIPTRSSTGDLVLAFKHAEASRPGFFDSVEVEAPVGEPVLAAALEDPSSLLDLSLAPVTELSRRFERPALAWTGRLENERVRRTLEPGRAPPGWRRPVVLEVDRVVFPGGIEEHELEVELGPGTDARAAEAWLLDELRARGIVAEPEPFTKLERLLRRAAGGPVSPSERLP
jgi:hypothetical protein